MMQTARLVLVLLIVACSPSTSTSTASLETCDGGCIDAPADASSEYLHWQVQAALLDPRAYKFVRDTGHAMDLTVPTGRTWYVVQMFQVQINTPQIFSEDAYPGYDDSGYLRKLHVDQALPLGAGSRIRCNTNKNGSYFYYADPQIVIDLDARYTTDPRALYFDRMARLATLPIRQAMIEMIPGGDNSKELSMTLPTDWSTAMVVGASVYDSTWVLICGMNTMNERDNHGTVRFAEKLLAPIWRMCSNPPSGQAGVVTVSSSNPGGTATIMTKAGTARGAPYGTAPTSPAPDRDPFFFNRKGVGEVLYVPLPSDW